MAESLDYSAFPLRNETKSSRIASIHVPIHSTPLCKGRKNQITTHSSGEIFVPFPIFIAIPSSSFTAAIGFPSLIHSIQSITQSLGSAHQICLPFSKAFSYVKRESQFFLHCGARHSTQSIAFVSHFIFVCQLFIALCLFIYGYCCPLIA
jgi:hypothetical protein